MLPHDTRAQSGATPDDARKGGIYIIRLSDTHYYGGRTTNFKKRWADHHRKLRAGRHNNLWMQRVFNRHGRFEPEVVEALHPDDCPEAEQAWLDANFGKPGCVNLVASSRGGMAGWEATPESRAKRSATFRARPDLIEKARASIARNRVFATKESHYRGVLKTAAKMRGRTQPPETVARRAAALRGRKRRQGHDLFVPPVPQDPREFLVNRYHDLGVALVPFLHGDDSRSRAKNLRRRG